MRMGARFVVKLSRDEMERRRLGACRELLMASDRDEWGFQHRIAGTYGVTSATVSRWASAVNKGGLDAVRATKASGVGRLTVQQKERLRTILVSGASEHGFDSEVWTGKRVAQIIREEFGVRFAPKYVPQLLRHQLGFSWQKPARKPRELDPAKVRKWRRESWEPTKKRRSRASARSGSWTKPA